MGVGQSYKSTNRGAAATAAAAGGGKIIYKNGIDAGNLVLAG